MPDSGDPNDVIDEAIELAASRTHEAQRTVADEIQAAGVPDGAAVERVERRAEDLHGLARQAAVEPLTFPADGEDADLASSPAGSPPVDASQPGDRTR